MAVAPAQVPAYRGRLIGILLAGCALSVGLGVYGREHDPTGHVLFTLFFTATINLKVWFATAALACAVFQIASALRMYGKIKVPRTAPKWLGDAHRLSGTFAFVFSLPVAYHCLWALGFASDTAAPRRLIHSLLGCAFYGAFAAKVAIVRSSRLPGWALPLAGGTVFTLLSGLWLTSALWFFTTRSFPGF